jgi:hypothetical protein
MLLRILFTCTTLLFLLTAYAQEAVIPLDLIELLGDLDDNDSELLDATISELELKTFQDKTRNSHTKKMDSGQSKAMPQEIKK